MGHTISYAKTFILFCCFISFQVFGQHDTTFIIEDFNRDGAVDTLVSYYQGGSGFGGRQVTVTNGKNNERYALSNDGCFCEIKRTILVPSNLNRVESQPFLNAMKKQLLPPKKDSPESSLAWMINGAFRNLQLDSNIFFDLIVDPQTKWVDKKYKNPTNYYLEISGDTLHQLYDTYARRPVNTTNKGFLVYYAHNHYMRYWSGRILSRNRKIHQDSLLLADSSKSYKVLHTAHGVVVRKGNSHKWVFISDVDLTGAPEKLRWESVVRVKLVGKYVLIQQRLPPEGRVKLFLVNIETGRCGRMKFDFDERKNRGHDSFTIQHGDIMLNTEKGQLQFNLNELFEALEKQDISNK
ncbi:MAG: hypothetical protein AAGI07_02770 [Bacteroidota bacterium]